MKAKIVSFRRSRKSAYCRHVIVDAGKKSKAEASSLVGKKAVWSSSGAVPKKIEGRISAAHGGKGLLRAVFSKGLPGQAVSTEVEISA